MVAHSTMTYCLSTVNKQVKEKGSQFLILTHVIPLLVSKVALHAHCLECNGEGTMLVVSASVTWECITDDLLNVASILFMLNVWLPGRSLSPKSCSQM